MHGFSAKHRSQGLTPEGRKEATSTSRPQRARETCIPETPRRRRGRGGKEKGEGESARERGEATGERESRGRGRGTGGEKKKGKERKITSNTRPKKVKVTVKVGRRKRGGGRLARVDRDVQGGERERKREWRTGDRRRCPEHRSSSLSRLRRR